MLLLLLLRDASYIVRRFFLFFKHLVDLVHLGTGGNGGGYMNDILRTLCRPCGQRLQAAARCCCCCTCCFSFLPLKLLCLPALLLLLRAYIVQCSFHDRYLIALFAPCGRHDEGFTARSAGYLALDLVARYGDFSSLCWQSVSRRAIGLRTVVILI